MRVEFSFANMYSVRTSISDAAWLALLSGARCYVEIAKVIPIVRSTVGPRVFCDGVSVTAPVCSSTRIFPDLNEAAAAFDDDSDYGFEWRPVHLHSCLERICRWWLRLLQSPGLYLYGNNGGFGSMLFEPRNLFLHHVEFQQISCRILRCCDP